MPLLWTREFWTAIRISLPLTRWDHQAAVDQPAACPEAWAKMLCAVRKKLAGTDAKDALVGAIRKSFDYCADAVAKTTDSQLGEEVTMFGRPTGLSRAAAMITIATDWADHYSTAASYLRLNGILPPTAQTRK